MMITELENTITKGHVFLNDNLYTNYFSDNENPSSEIDSVYNNQWNGNSAFMDWDKLHPQLELNQ